MCEQIHITIINHRIVSFFFKSDLYNINFIYSLIFYNKNIHAIFYLNILQLFQNPYFFGFLFFIFLKVVFLFPYLRHCQHVSPSLDDT